MIEGEYVKITARSDNNGKQYLFAKNAPATFAVHVYSEARCSLMTEVWGSSAT